MKEAGTIRFEDLETKREAIVIVRYDAHCVALAISHPDDGDLEVVMGKEAAVRVLEALAAATT
jgi:hypothetical protein